MPRQRQRGATPDLLVIDDRVTVDAGSIGIALNEAQRRTIRDVVVTHPHMDHIASLPIFC